MGPYGVTARDHPHARPLGKAPLEQAEVSVVHRDMRGGTRRDDSGSGSVSARLHVLSCPPAMCPHVEFAVAAVLETPVSLTWTAQPALPGLLQAVLEVAAAPGTAGALATRLRRLGPVRFEVVEGPAPGVDAERYSGDPDLGLHRAALAANGDVVVSEGQLRSLLAAAAGEATVLVHGLERLLGTAWDGALEPLRVGGEGAPVSWLRRTG